MAQAITLIVGLGNPGAEYANTRHNAGAWLAHALVAQANQSLRLEKKFQASVASVTIAEQPCRIMIPSTYMNCSGQAVKAVAHFYKILPQSILVAHDELDLPVDRVQIKQGGGHGGHNGLRDIISHLGTNDFMRCRIGIGHPGHRDQVHDYVLSKPSRAQDKAIHDSIDQVLSEMPRIVSGDVQAAMRALHGRVK